MKTLTEKYRLVLEEKFSKKQFVTDARRLHPNLVTQLNSFDDTVSILKNKGLIFEELEKYKAEKSPEYERERTADDYSLDHLERAIDVELEEKGFDTTSIDFTEEEYLAAKKKAITNLEKDYNYYLNKLAGVKSITKRTDEMKPVEKEFVDKDNEMTKVKLKEGFKKLIKNIISEEG